MKYKDATFLKESLRGLFIHGRDHPITHGHVFCQRFAWETYKVTFGDINVYEQLPVQPSQAEVFLRSTTSRPFLRRYKWGVNLRTSSLPIAYILLKQQKDFKAARPIISYVHFLYAQLFVLLKLPWISSFAVFAPALLALIPCQASYRS